MTETISAAAGGVPTPVIVRRRARSDLAARGEPFVWLMGAALVAGLAMIIGFLAFVIYVGALTFWPSPIEVVTRSDGKIVAGEVFRAETYRVPEDAVKAAAPDVKARIEADRGFADRTLYRVGNYDIFGEDFVWVSEFDKKSVAFPRDIYMIERVEWGPFIGRIKEIDLSGTKTPEPTMAQVVAAHKAAEARRKEIDRLDKVEIAGVNHEIEGMRLEVRRVELDYGAGSAETAAAKADVAKRTEVLQASYRTLEQEVAALRQADETFTATLEAVDGQTKTLPVSRFMRLYRANDMSTSEKWSIYASRWGEFISGPPREANTEGGVFPALVGTLTMMVLLSLAVAPFGVVTALYLREYAKQGALVSFIRICVNNLAGVPSIVYGVFGLGFFCYILGGSIDQIFVPEKLPTPTFGTGGMLWASLTLALLTVPVVIVESRIRC